MANLYRVQTIISGTLVAGGGLNSLYFNPLNATEQNAASAVLTFWQGVAPKVNSSVTFTVDTQVAIIDEVTGQIESLTAVTGGTVVGGTSFEPLPPSSQALVQWRTGTFSDGREIRGRTFIPGTTENDTNTGKPLPALITAIDTAAAALINNASSELVIWRRPRAADPTHVPPVAARPGTHAAVTSGNLWDKYAVLRGRRD